MKDVVKEHSGPKSATWGAAVDYSEYHWIDSDGNARGYDDHTLIFRCKTEENARRSVERGHGYLVTKVDGRWVPA